MRRSWIEIGCDACGQADYYPSGSSDADFRANGWIVSKDKKHFCDEDCRQQFQKKMREHSAAERD